MDPNVAGGIMEALVGGAITSIFWAIGIGVIKKNGKVKCAGSNGHCKDHKGLVDSIQIIKESGIRTETNVEWIVREFKNGRHKN